MGIFSKFEGKMEDTFEGAGKMSSAPISPVQIAKKAEKQMRRETMVGAGKQYAPTLYTVLVNPDDDARLFGYYPTLAGETETYLSGKAAQAGLAMDGRPLVRFIVDDGLKHGKFEIIAEMVASPIIEQLRAEEMERYGIASQPLRRQQPAGQQARGYDEPQNDYGYDEFDDQQGYGYDQPADGYGYDQPADGYGYDGYQDEYADDGWDGAYGYELPEDQFEEPQQPMQPQPKPPLPYVPEEEIDRSIDYGEYTFNSEDFEDYREKADSQDIPQAYNDMAPEPEPHPQMQAPNTVAFAGGPTVPNRRTVRARMVDLTYKRPYDLGGTLVTIGRESSNDIVVQDINASRRHAELRLNKRGIWVVTDLGSMNGTLVNGVSVASHPLYPGDIVTIGKTDFEFTLV